MKNVVIVLLAFGLVASALLNVFGGDAGPAARTSTDRSAAQSTAQSTTTDRATSPVPAKSKSQERDRPNKIVAEPTAPAEPTAEAETNATQRREILAQLKDPATTASGQSKLWRKLAELGLTDEAIAEFREQLKLNPRDSQVHTLLGNALITKMRTESLDPAERRAVTTGAMKSFDTALELDPQNWTARFSRAMSNSAAPAFLGRQAVAIKDFEKLIEQQEGAAPSPDHAHTYFFLANLKAGSGNAAGAKKVRAEARALFPDDARFQERTRNE